LGGDGEHGRQGRAPHRDNGRLHAAGAHLHKRRP
jgi:hypothetical protein